ncbi:hypothetical protein ACFFJY_12420 [Fictibacillus aquaticus]|uniref:DUF2642 domain-containing protein n=1 Tax=Fictibacillus aquaticus TaxID=2021314 RepID=A0A235FCJ4_9BACL|nr:hypothetical protein [Fictibacillus aquaticus]OYD59046.1 hypothetical protein CGZ90_03850 [Fictibacillus aquaticus]
MSSNASTLRGFLVKLLANKTLVTEVFLQNSNQPQGTPDLSGVTVVEVGLDYVVFSQAGSGAGTLYYVNLDRILLIDL